LGQGKESERTTKKPTMFNSRNWEAFKMHTFKVIGWLCPARMVCRLGRTLYIQKEGCTDHFIKSYSSEYE
jgi:hypothetical protein